MPTIFRLAPLEFFSVRCSVHYATVGMQRLKEHFQNRGIGRGSPLIDCPFNSQDLTILDYFLCGEITQKFIKPSQHT